MNLEAWRCKHHTDLMCPDEGCPVTYGCARDKGWQPGQPSPRECQGLPPLENMISHKNYNPKEIALIRLVAVAWHELHLTEGQIARIIETDIVSVRRMADDGIESLEKRPIPGRWGAGVMQRTREPAR